MRKCRKSNCVQTRARAIYVGPYQGHVLPVQQQPHLYSPPERENKKTIQQEWEWLRADSELGGPRIMHINDEKFDNFAMTLMQNLNVIMVQIENII